MKWIVGIDEVGRGALAGPVVVAAAALPIGATPKSLTLGPLKDSKKLSAKQREAWCEQFFMNPHLEFAIARVYPRQIEKKNISKAANMAAERAFSKLVKDHKLHPASAVFLDGGLFLGNRVGAKTRKNTMTVIKGDEKIGAIAVASIIAKVHRDDVMRRLGKKYPVYGFEVHKGYGTKAHAKAIRKHGPSEAHRLTFLPQTIKMNKN